MDDETALLDLLARQLRRIGFEVHEAGSLEDARSQLSERELDLVVCDLHLTDGSGLELAREVRAAHPATATVLISGDGGPEPVRQALADDVDEYLLKPFGMEQLAVTAEQALRRRRERTVEPALIEHLSRAGRYHDEETAEHVQRMSRACALMASQLGWDPEACIELQAASALHDIGKVGVPDAVLRKPGKLGAEERALMERHAEMGYEILRGSTDPVMVMAATIALTHHERFDGGGYPRGLSGDEIPIEGRIAAVADVFDALTHDRPYRPAFSAAEARELVREGSGTHFDPVIVEAFEAVAGQVEEMGVRHPDGGVAGAEPEEGVPDAAIRVLVVEDHDAVARGIELLLRREGFEIAGSARNLAEATRNLERRDVDVALVDLQLGEEDGLALVPVVKELGARALIYTGLLDSVVIAAARRAGADGMAAKAGPPAELVAALRAVSEGASYWDARFQSENGRRSALTPRESEIVGLLASGLNGEEIARRLFVSPATVRTHIRNAMERVDARTRAHLVMLGARQGVRPAPDVHPDNPS